MKYVPATPAPERTRSPKNKAMFVLSPVFGASLVFVGVSGVVGCSGVGSSGVSGTSVIVTVCPSSSMSLCSVTLVGFVWIAQIV